MLVVLCCFLTFCFSCSEKEKKFKTLEVTANAYNSFHWQTKVTNSNVAAWGDTLSPGERSIAVSRDLIDSGLVHNKVVFIEGFEGEYLVKDKMNKRYKKRIDIFMGKDLKRAREFGKRKLKIWWEVEPENKP
jgi:3D (Asp-Asp-Asp) domain-containing protein